MAAKRSVIYFMFSSDEALGGSPAVKHDEGRFGAMALRGLAAVLQVKKGGTAEDNLSSLVTRDEGFYFF